MRIWPETKKQRCWVHKAKNVLDKLPKSEQKKAKERLKDIYMAGTKADAQKAFDLFVKTYEDKFDRAVDCLRKDRGELMSFFDFPAAHWKHLRTTNPIESSFATIKLRTAKTRGCLPRTSALSMVYQLGLLAEKGWRKINRPELLGAVLANEVFVDGEKVATAA